jgi:IS4 transposase
LELKETLYALDSTTIDLCLTLFPWADFRRTKAAIKVRGPIPAFIDFSDGRSHGVNALDVVPIPKRSIVTMDRGYTDWERLYAIHCLPAYFVIRAKDNLAFRRLASSPVKKSMGLRADQTITFTTWQARHDYPETLRPVVFFDAEQQRRLAFLTNHFGIPAKTVADIYNSRWQIELFFKWIKQHLVIKSFYGTSPNAVKTQVWIALDRLSTGRDRAQTTETAGQFAHDSYDPGGQLVRDSFHHPTHHRDRSTTRHARKHHHLSRPDPGVA